MATFVDSVDELSVLDRKLILEGLSLKFSVLTRAIKAATNDAVMDALVLESQSVELLRSRFR